MKVFIHLSTPSSIHLPIHLSTHPSIQHPIALYFLLGVVLFFVCFFCFTKVNLSPVSLEYRSYSKACVLMLDCGIQSQEARVREREVGQ